LAGAPGYHLCPVESLQGAPVKNLDSLPPQAEESPVLESFQRSAHALAGRPQFFREHLMSDPDRFTMEKQAASQALIQAAEDHIIDERHEVSHPLGEESKDERAKGRGLQDKIQEHIAWHPKKGEIRFGRSHGWIRHLAEERHHRNDAGFPRVQPVQEDLLAVGPALCGTYDSFDQQWETGAGCPFREKLPAGSCPNRNGLQFYLFQKRLW